MTTLQVFRYRRYVLLCGGAQDPAGGFQAQLSVRHQDELTPTPLPLSSYSFPTEYDAIECARAGGMAWVQQQERAGG